MAEGEFASAPSQFIDGRGSGSLLDFFNLMAAGGAGAPGGLGMPGAQGLPGAYGSPQLGLQPGGFGVGIGTSAAPGSTVGPSPNATQTTDQTGYSTPEAAPGGTVGGAPSNGASGFGGAPDAGRGGISNGPVGGNFSPPSPPGLARSDNMGYARTPWGYSISRPGPSMPPAAPGTFGFYSDPMNTVGMAIDTKTPSEAVGMGYGAGGQSTSSNSDHSVDSDHSDHGGEFHQGGDVTKTGPARLKAKEHVVSVPGVRIVGRKFLRMADKLGRQGLERDAALKQLMPHLGKD